MLVCESAGDSGICLRLNARAVDATTRELLRDDDWMVALGQEETAGVSDALVAAVSRAAECVAEFKPGQETPAAEAHQSEHTVVALTAALVAWPFVAVARTGEGAVAHLQGGRLSLPFEAAPDSGDGEPSANVKAWSAELGASDGLILATRLIQDAVLADREAFGKELAGAATAKRIVDLVLARMTDPAEAAIAVAKLSEGNADQMQSLAEQTLEASEGRGATASTQNESEPETVAETIVPVTNEEA